MLFQNPRYEGPMPIVVKKGMEPINKNKQHTIPDSNIQQKQQEKREERNK